MSSNKYKFNKKNLIEVLRLPSNYLNVIKYFATYIVDVSFRTKNYLWLSQGSTWEKCDQKSNLKCYSTFWLDKVNLLVIVLS